ILPATPLEHTRDPLWNSVVLPPVEILGPAVEPEADNGHFAVSAREGSSHTSAAVSENEDGAEVARPSAIRGKGKELDPAQVHAATRQDARRACLVRPGVDEDSDDFSRSDLPDDLAVDPRDGRKFSGPVAQVVGPPDPGSLVWFPLSGHAETKRCWREPRSRLSSEHGHGREQQVSQFRCFHRDNGSRYPCKHRCAGHAGKASGDGHPPGAAGRLLPSGFLPDRSILRQ